MKLTKVSYAKRNRFCVACRCRIRKGDPQVLDFRAVYCPSCYRKLEGKQP